MQLLDLYLTRSKQADSRALGLIPPSNRLIQAVRFGSLSGNLTKIIPDEIVNRFVKYITQQLNGILSANPFLWQ